MHDLLGRFQDLFGRVSLTARRGVRIFRGHWPRIAVQMETSTMRRLPSLVLLALVVSLSVGAISSKEIGKTPVSVTCDYPGRVGPEVPVSTGGQSTNSRIVWTGAEYGVAFDVQQNPVNPGEIRFRRLGPEGSPIAAETTVSTQTGAPCRPTLMWSGDGYGVAWLGPCNENAGMYFSRLDATGAKIGPDVPLATPAFAYVTSGVWNGQEYGIAWSDIRSSVSGIYFARVSRNGTLLGPATRVTGSIWVARVPSLVWTGSEYAVTWDGQLSRNGAWGIYLSRFTQTGLKIGPDLPVSTTGSEGDASLVWTGTGFGVTWFDNRDGDHPEIYFARLDATGNRIGSDVRVTNDPGDSFLPSIVWTGSEFGVSWDDRRETRDVYFARLDAEGGKLGEDLRVSHEPDESLLSRLVWTGSEYGISWTGYSDFFGSVSFARVGCAVTNQPPVADAGEDIAAECASPLGTGIRLDGSRSTD